MSCEPIPVEKSFAEWREDPAYRAAYAALDEEFALATAQIKAQTSANILQKEIAKPL